MTLMSGFRGSPLGGSPVSSGDAAAVEGVRRTLAAYCQHCDDGRFDAWQRLWAPDARLEVMGRRYEGPEAIRAFIEAAQPPQSRGKHLTANAIVDVTGDDATATADYAFVGWRSGHPAVTSVGRYHDRLRRDPSGWLFVLRRIEIASPAE